jgi:hypothetical protein
VPRFWKNSFLKSIDPLVLNVACKPDGFCRGRLLGKSGDSDVPVFGDPMMSAARTKDPMQHNSSFVLARFTCFKIRST